MPDQNTRFLLPEHRVRGQIVKLERSYQSVLANAAYPPAVGKLLGQALAAVSALGSTIKLHGSIILQIQGEGPVHTLVAQANNAGEIRGLAHGYESIADETHFEELLGKGRLVLTIEGERNKRYQGIVEIHGPHLSDALQTYFEQSEQLLTHIQLAANDQHAACFLLQQLPGGPEDDGIDGWQHAKLLSETLSAEELLNLDVQETLHRLFHEDDVQLYAPSPLRFHCRCSREKIIPVIEQMGLADAMKLVDEQGEIRADCEFCNRAYRFDRVDIAGLFMTEFTAPSNPQ